MPQSMPNPPRHYIADERCRRGNCRDFIGASADGRIGTPLDDGTISAALEGTKVGLAASERQWQGPNFQHSVSSQSRRSCSPPATVYEIPVAHGANCATETTSPCLKRADHTDRATQLGRGGAPRAHQSSQCQPLGQTSS